MNQKILIIDGHPVYIYKTEGFLRGLSFQNVFLATSGKEGIEKVCTDKPELVILSGMLPDQDSLEVCQIIKKESKETKVIVQIGLFTDNMVVSKFDQAGADAILARKEKNLVPLQSAIEKLLHLPSTA